MSSQKTKKHSSTLDRCSAFLFGFAFSFDHPGWAKGNFLICSVFFVRMKKLRGESHPLSLNSPQMADIYQIREGRSSSKASRADSETMP
jgi:hypothetical protein